MGSSSEGADFPAPAEDLMTYRARRVVAVLDDPDSVQKVMEELAEAGFPREEIHVLSGPEGAQRLDVTGRHHGLRGRIYRFIEHVLGDEHQWLHEHSERIARGGYGIAVTASEDNRSAAARILARHGAQDAAYFDEFHWQRL